MILNYSNLLLEVNQILDIVELNNPHVINSYAIKIIGYQLGDNCIQNINLGRCIVGYTVGNLVLR